MPSTFSTIRSTAHPGCRFTQNILFARVRRPGASLSAPGREVRLGRALFQFRSYTLIPLVALLGWLYFRAAMESWLIWPWALGGSLLVFGEAIRFHIAGHARPGTSGRGTTLRAATLVTDGMYAATRNPLYLANWLQWLGAATITGIWWAPPVCAGVVALQYHFIIRAEESFLAEQFGPRFDQFQRNTPRFFPRLNFRVFACDFDFRRALFREHDTVFLVFLGLWTLPTISAALQGAFLWPWLAIGVISTATWAGTKWAKKRAGKWADPLAGDASSPARKKTAVD